MNSKKITSIVVSIIVTIGIASCGGTGSSGPVNAASTQYGQLNSITQLNFNSGTTMQPESLEDVLINQGINKGFTESSPIYLANLGYLAAPQTAGGLGFNATGIAGNAANLGVESVTAYVINYDTPGTNPDTNPADINRKVSGLVLLPIQSNGSLINNPKGIVVFYHPTEIGKNSVPSCLTPLLISNSPAYCNFNNTDPLSYAGVDGDIYYQQLAAVYAAAGYIVAAPDYVGMGVDNTIVHPYVVYPQVNSDSGLYMVRAVREMLSQQNMLQESIELNLFITGFSEGGSYALNASQQAQTKLSSFLSNQNMNLTMTAPAEGAYDLAGQLQFSFADVMDGVLYCGLNPNGTPISCTPPQLDLNSWKIGSSAYAASTKPSLTALAITTVGYYGFNNIGNAYQMLMYPDFFNVPLLNPFSTPPQPIGESANLVQLFTSPLYSNAQLGTSISYNGYGLKNPANNLYYGGGLTGSTAFSGMNNSIEAFVNPGIQNNPQFTQIINGANTYRWITQSPLNFIHLNYDSVVTIANYDAAYQAMSQSTPDLVSQTTIQNSSIANVNPATNFYQYQANVPPYNAIPLDHGASQPFMMIGALCAFEHSADFTGICL